MTNLTRRQIASDVLREMGQESSFTTDAVLSCLEEIKRRRWWELCFVLSMVAGAVFPMLFLYGHFLSFFPWMSTGAFLSGLSIITFASLSFYQLRKEGACLKTLKGIIDSDERAAMVFQRLAEQDKFTASILQDLWPPKVEGPEQIEER